MTTWCAICGHVWEGPGPAETITWPHCALDSYPHPEPPKEAPEGREMAPARIARTR